MAIQNYTRRLTAAILHLVQPDVGPCDPPTPQNTLEPNVKWIRRPVAEMWPFEICQDARSVGRQYIH